MSQNVIHQRTSPHVGPRSSGQRMSQKTATTGLRHPGPFLAGPYASPRQGSASRRSRSPQVPRSRRSPGSARDPDRERQADARDQGAVGEDRCDQEAGTEEPPRRTGRRKARRGFPAETSPAAFTARARASPSIPGPIARSATGAAPPATCRGRSSGWRAWSPPGGRGCPAAAPRPSTSAP